MGFTLEWCTMNSDGPTNTAPGLRELAIGARLAVERAVTLVRPQAKRVVIPDLDGYKWDLFLDEPGDIIETCALASAITILATGGEPLDSELLNTSVRTLRHIALRPGGWTSWLTPPNSANNHEAPLVLDTFYALRALSLVGQQDCIEFVNGLNWICSAVNPVGAWGFHAQSAPFVLPTSYAIRVLLLANPSLQPQAREEMNRGISWLIRVQDPNTGGWGRTEGASPSAVHTALALLALSEAGSDRFHPAIVRGRDYLLNVEDHTANAIDYYLTPSAQVDEKTAPSRAISHINYSNGLLLQGLLAAKTGLIEHSVLQAVESLITAQADEGFWNCPHAPKERPIFAVMDAVLGLQRFTYEVDRDAQLLEMCERLQALTLSHAELQHQTLALQAKVLAEESTTQILERLQSSITSQKTELANLASSIRDIDDSLVLLQPIRTLGTLCSRYPMLVLFWVGFVTTLAIALFTLIKYGSASKSFSGSLVAFTAVTGVTGAIAVADWNKRKRQEQTAQEEDVLHVTPTIFR